jgi:hypothetical protein
MRVEKGNMHTSIQIPSTRTGRWRSGVLGAALAAGALTVGTVGLVAGSAGPASASPTAAPAVPIHETVRATTTLAKLHQTVTVPPGTFDGTVDLGTDGLQGNLVLPPATTTVAMAGVGLATATFDLAPVKPVVGTVDLSTLAVTATATFNVLITSVDPLGLPVNLVGDSCGTSTPVTVAFSGVFSFTGPSTFAGSYTIPPLSDCGLLTPALNLVIPGPGNQFSASFAPGD